MNRRAFRRDSHHWWLRARGGLLLPAAFLIGCGAPTAIPSAVPPRAAPVASAVPAAVSTPTPSPTVAPPAAAAPPAAGEVAAVSTAPALVPPAPSRAPAVAPPPRPAAAPAPPAPPPPSAGWSLIAFYTPVESFHSGAPQAIQGCATPDCPNGVEALGSYPSDFLQAVQQVDAGRVTSGAYTGRYLFWTAAEGYWLDTSTRDAGNQPLRPFVSTVADASIALGTGFQVLSCGVDKASGSPTDPSVCDRFRSASWVVTDHPAAPGAARELDLYIGEEDAPDFANASPLVIDNVNAQTTLK
jgi:hypothetical protein